MLNSGRKTYNYDNIYLAITVLDYISSLETQIVFKKYTSIHFTDLYFCWKCFPNISAIPTVIISLRYSCTEKMYCCLKPTYQNWHPLISIIGQRAKVWVFKPDSLEAILSVRVYNHWLNIYIKMKARIWVWPCHYTPFIHVCRHLSHRVLDKMKTSAHVGSLVWRTRAGKPRSHLW